MKHPLQAQFLGHAELHTREYACIHNCGFHYRYRAFSILELLSVMAIVGVLVTATMPALGNAAAAARRTSYLANLSSLIEGARQHAVSKNTYVWVSFSAGGEGRPLYASVVASRNGLAHGYGPDDVWTARQVNVANNADYMPVSRVMNLGDFELKPQNQSFANSPSFTVKSGADSVELSRSIQFSPAGEARIGPGIRGNIVFETSATQGRMTEVTDTLSINGPTGLVKVQSDIP